jgi:methylmalonyl-CoA mutase
METQYQRAKIQEESMYYEMRKFSGELPIIGVNTFLNPHRAANALEVTELIRATDEEKELQIRRLREFQSIHADAASDALQSLQKVAISGENVFEELMSTVQYCSLGQISSTLFKIGGEYRRNL